MSSKRTSISFIPRYKGLVVLKEYLLKLKFCRLRIEILMEQDGTFRDKTRNNGQRQEKAKDLLQLYKQASISEKFLVRWRGRNLLGVYHSSLLDEPRRQCWAQGSRPDKKRATKWNDTRSSTEIHIYQPTVNGTVKIINVEPKRNNREEDNGRTLKKVKIDDSIEDGVDDLTICGLQIIGFLGRSYVMDLRYDGIYRMILIGEFELPRSTGSWGDIVTVNKDRNVQSQKEAIWKLAEDLIIAFQLPNPTTHELFKHTMEINETGLFRGKKRKMDSIISKTITNDNNESEKNQPSPKRNRRSTSNSAKEILSQLLTYRSFSDDDQLLYKVLHELLNSKQMESDKIKMIKPMFHTPIKIPPG
ncbi:24327_t:CDS:2 [Gigaspora rosea]|nr:24327_t:CDS:2 [Gigaspora rosea]